MDALTTNKMLVRASIHEIWDQRHFENIGTFVTDDFVDHSAPPGTRPGPADFVDGVRRILAAFPDATNDVEEMVAEGDRVVTRWTMTGTHTGDGLGFPATGRAVRLSGVTVARITDGRIAEHWSYRDDIGFLRQLGMIP